MASECNSHSVILKPYHLTYFRQGSANYILQAKSSLSPIFVNKILLGHSNAHSDTLCLWAALLLQWQSWVVASETLYLSIFKNSLQTPVLDNASITIVSDQHFGWLHHTLNSRWAHSPIKTTVSLVVILNK